MSIAYGYDIEPQNDYFVSLAEEAVSRVSLAVFPGAALVNAIPILRHLPPWFPGAGFHKIASETKEMTTKMQEVPLKWVQKNMVCDHLSAIRRHKQFTYAQEEGIQQNCIVSKYLPHCKTDKDLVPIKEYAALIYAGEWPTLLEELRDADTL